MERETAGDSADESPAGAPADGAPADETSTGAPRSRSWRRWLIVAALLLVVDALQPSSRQPSRYAALGAIDVYQATLSKLMPSIGISCRFEPTCSRFAEGAIDAHGTWVGIGLAAKRLVRCGPWTPAGTVDPPPGRTD